MRLTAGVLGAWLLAGGCSFLAVRPPPTSTKPHVNVSCTDERYPPAFDVAATAGNAVLLFNKDDLTKFAALLGVIGYGISAVYGYQVTNECAHAKDEAYRFHARLLLRQNDLLEEVAGQADDDEIEELSPARVPPAPKRPMNPPGPPVPQPLPPPVPQPAPPALPLPPGPPSPYPN